MDLDHPDKTEAAIAALLACGPLKVWSVVVTILGDLSQSRKTRLSGRLLTRLVGQMGITNQALRVALHRLKRDGWVEAEKQGRTSTYRLSAQGWASTEAVRPLIYAPPPDLHDTTVMLALAPPDLTTAEIDELLPEDAQRLSPRSALLLSTQLGEAWQDDWLCSPLAPLNLPNWVVEALCPPALAADYAALKTACPDATLAAAAAPLDRAVLRLLTLHHWRRLRLRHGALPDLLLRDEWVGAAVRDQVLQVLDHAPRPDIAALEQG